MGELDRNKPSTDLSNHPAGFRALIRQWNCWSIGIRDADGNKTPAVYHVDPTAKTWKADNAWTTYEKAVVIRDKLIEQGIDANLMFALFKTEFKVGDVDPAGADGQLRDDQQELLDHYRTEHPTLIVPSWSGGHNRHLYFNDPNNQLPKIGPNKVKNGLSPCEIKGDIIFVTGKVDHAHFIAMPDQHLIDICKEAKRSATTPKQPSGGSKDLPDNPPPPPPALMTDQITVYRSGTPRPRDYAKAQSIVNEFRLRNMALCTNNDEFLEIAFILKSVGFSNAETIRELDIDAAIEGRTFKDTATRVRSIKPTQSQINHFIKFAIERGVLPADYPFVKSSEPSRKITLYKQNGNLRNWTSAVNQLGIKFRYHELQGEQIKLPKGEWHRLTDEMLFKVQHDYVSNHCNLWTKSGPIAFEPPHSIRREAALGLAHGADPYNPTREWLQTIQAKEDWSAIDTILSCYKLDPFGRLQSAGYSPGSIKEHGRHGLSGMLTQVVRRTMWPGSIADTFFVLVGPQGCGKGLLLKTLLPPKSIDQGKLIPNDAFIGECRLSDERADWYRNRQASIGEVTELIGLSRPGNERLKAIISATHDNHEQKYKSFADLIPKHYILFGSTNDLNFKPLDPTGDRRFYPLDIGFIDENGKLKVATILLEVINDDVRRRAFGHALWLVNNGYTATANDWPEAVQNCRDHLCGQSAKRYPEIEIALAAIANGDIDRERLEMQHLLMHIPSPAEIREYGLPFDPPTYPTQHVTWMRLLTGQYPHLARLHRDKVKFVATEHLGWEFHSEKRQRLGLTRCRGWLIPR